MGVQRRCPGCRSWYDKKKTECPSCGRPPHGFNKWLRTAQLNSHLYQAAEKSVRDDRAVGRA